MIKVCLICFVMLLIFSSDSFGLESATRGVVNNTFQPIVVVTSKYPNELKNDGVKGECIVTFSVGHDGKVYDISDVKCEPSGYFEKYCKDSVRKWLFRKNDGNHVALKADCIYR